ncbi:MAG: M42 family metallopeptidase [Clostridiales bacterium]|nr:M42 family metallopeptidase [Clostridiales bacterium]
MDIKKTLFDLCAIPSPSGFENKAAARITELMLPLVDEVKTDKMGNVIGILRCGEAGAPTLLVDSHMDEIGIIITGSDEGFLTFAALGGADARVLPGREVILMTEPPAYGVISCLPPHVLKTEQREKPIAIKDMYIDVGFSQETSKRKFPPGTPGILRGDVFMLGDSCICGRALDNRSCVAVMLSVADRLKGKKLKSDLVFMASVQEELGCRGAAAGAFGTTPDYAVILDVTHAATPDAPKIKTVKYGGGAAVGIGPNMNAKMSADLFRTAQKHGICCQPEVMSGNSGTNAWPVQISREGIATAVVSLPLRYMHTQVEAVRLDDIESVVSLTAAFIVDWGEWDA